MSLEFLRKPLLEHVTMANWDDGIKKKSLKNDW
jgi:hypothetical protein